MYEHDHAEDVGNADRREHAELTDTRLAELIRAGAPAAHPASQELRRRHLPAMLSYARLCARDEETGERLTERAFSHGMREACQGVDPPGTWRHRLLMLVAGTAGGWAEEGRRHLLRPDFVTRDNENEAVRRDGNASTLFAAFRELPEHMRCVLWHGVVEEEPDTVVSVYTGTGHEDIAEAKEKALGAVRRACLDVHFERRADPRCRAYRRLVEAAALPGTTRPDAGLSEHTRTCQSCSRMLAELTRLTRHPRTALAENLLPWGGAAYLSTRPAPDPVGPPGLKGPAQASAPPAPEPAAAGHGEAPSAEVEPSAGTAPGAARPRALSRVAATATAASAVVCLVLGIAWVPGESDRAEHTRLAPSRQTTTVPPTVSVSPPSTHEPEPGTSRPSAAPSPTESDPSDSPEPARRPHPATAPTPIATPSPTGSASPAADPFLRPGDRGGDVIRLQQLLFEQGKTYVQPTGVYDGETARAVTDVQQERSLSGDPLGVYGPVTRSALDPGRTVP